MNDFLFFFFLFFFYLFIYLFFFFDFVFIFSCLALRKFRHFNVTVSYLKQHLS